MDERPDEKYLNRVIEIIEYKTEEFNMKDEIAEEEDVVEGATLEIIEHTFQVNDTDKAEWVDQCFEYAATTLTGYITEKGYDICRPIGIRNPNLTAENGTFQLCKRGKKVSAYMAHRHEDGRTTVTLKMLLGQL